MRIVDDFKKVIEVPDEGIKTRGEKISIPPFLKGRVARVLISETCLKLRVKEMAKVLSKEKKEIYLVPILKGGVVFLADLMRNISSDVKLDFISVSSYIGGKSSGKPNLDLVPRAKGRDIFLVEDIVDTGNTLLFIKEYLLKKEKARAVKICALIDKPARREKKVKLDFVGFRIPNYFAVGYGLDYKQQFRNLPFVAAIKNY